MSMDKEKLEAELPADFLATYGPALHTAVETLGAMAAAGDIESIRNAAELFRLMVNAAMVVAAEVRKKQAAEFKPGWVL